MIRDTPRPTTEDVPGDIVAELARRAALYQLADSSADARAYLYRRASLDPIYWAGNFAWITAPQSLIGRFGKAIPILLWPYVVEGINVFLGREGYRTASGGLYPVVLAKSRETGGTKITSIATIWDWQFNDGADYGYISRVERAVDNNKATGSRSIFSFIRWAIRHQPAWLRPVGFRSPKRDRFLDNWLELINGGNGNTIVGSSTVVDAMRGDRRRRPVVDEANSIPDLDALLESLYDVGTPWLISSVKGRSTPFARVYHGEAGADVHDPETARGRAGWLRLRWHYSLRPDRRPGTAAGDAWIAEEKGRRSPEQWAQEQEIDFLASVPGRIWADAFQPDFHVLDAAYWRSDVLPYVHAGDLIEGWDFGYSVSLTVVVWAAVIDGVVYCLDYRAWEDAKLEQVVAGLVDAGYRCDLAPSATRPDYRVGDVASGSRARLVGGKKYKPAKSWIQNLRGRGVSIVGQRLEVEKAIWRVGELLRTDRLVFCPPCAVRRHGLPSLVDCVEQYRRRLPRAEDAADYVGDDPKPEKDVYSHAADALQHVVWRAWGKLQGARG